MIKKLRVAVDHGNRNMKTCHFIFTTGLTEQDKKPARGEKYLKYQGKYYTLSEKRIPYQRDKTQDSRNRFWILTLFAIAMELEQKSQIQPEDVIQVELPIGLPPKHFAELCERYERYFKGDGKVQELCFNDKVYVTELLNTTEKKAKLIVAAILAYTGRTDETGNGSISMEPDMLRPMMQQIIREEVRKVLEGQDVSKINREMPTEVDLMEEEPLRMDQTMRQNVVDAISAFRRA